MSYSNLGWVQSMQFLTSALIMDGYGTDSSVFDTKYPNTAKNPQWHTPVDIPEGRVFAVLTILKYMLDVVAP